MILITFVENCFKYGSFTDKDCTIHIQASDQNNCLLFQTENKIMRRGPTRQTIHLFHSHERIYSNHHPDRRDSLHRGDGELYQDFSQTRQIRPDHRRVRLL